MPPVKENILYVSLFFHLENRKVFGRISQKGNEPNELTGGATLGNLLNAVKKLYISAIEQPYWKGKEKKAYTSEVSGESL